MKDILKDGRSVVKRGLHGEMQALPGGTLVTSSPVALAVLHNSTVVMTSLHTPCWIPKCVLVKEFKSDDKYESTCVPKQLLYGVLGQILSFYPVDKIF